MVVIGAGIVGASAACHLARQGAEVTVVDRPADGQATAAGAGIVCPWVDHESDDAWYRLALEGARHYDHVPGAARVGAVLVADHADELAEVEALLRSRQAAAPDMGEIGPLDPAKVFPALRSGLAGLLVPGASRVDGRAVRDALLAEAVRRGARSRISPVTLTGDGEVVMASERVPADVVVVAAGAWTSELCAPMGLRTQVRPMRGQIVHLRLPAETAGWPIVLPRRGPYMLGFPGGRVVLGATVEDAGFDPRVTAGGVAEVLSAGLELAPGLAGATLAETRTGLRPVTADGRPILGRLTDRVIVATGLGAYGLTAGPYAGMVAARLALGGDPPIDLTPYDPR
ncbi:FAD-binding oxidoreductase [Streptosporangiaceae bacterium NEAU-GS5]|nr:FAD-binding oxidoreductase [Streptosporangiaceae bacterium NEAU-GS5]